jgi:hypothetical protein
VPTSTPRANPWRTPAQWATATRRGKSRSPGKAWDQDRLERFQAFLTGIPDFGAWLAERKAVEQAEREREQAMEERVRELIRVGMPWQEARELAANPPELDADVEALLEKAEIYLQQENQ